jgi:hypothetical protein
VLASRIRQSHTIRDIREIRGLLQSAEQLRISEFGIAFCDACHHQIADDDCYAMDLVLCQTNLFGLGASEVPFQLTPCEAPNPKS